MKELTVVTADTIPQWFKDLTRDAQRDYLKDHPNSRISRTMKSAGKQGQPVTKSTKKSAPANSAKPAQEILEQKGSPTGFKGPRTASESLSGEPKVERNIVSRLDKLYKAVQKAKSGGEAPPDFDLCKISIPGTNLFCNKNKGIPRKEMPQLKGKPAPNSWADINLPKDKGGEVDGEEAFKQMLKSKGVKITDRTVDASSLKATQSQLVGAKIVGMMNALKEDPHNKGITAPIFVSKDGYILDGHHRWAGMVALDMASGLKQSVQMPVHIVDMDIEDLVKETNDFADKIGIAAKAGKVKESASAVKYLEGLILVAANSVKTLRKDDVYRVLSEAPASDRKALGEYIIQSRSDLKAEVEEVLKEEFNIVLATLTFSGRELAKDNNYYRVVYGIKGFRQLPGYAFFNMTKYQIKAAVNEVKELLANRMRVKPDRVFLTLVDDADRVQWADNDNRLGMNQTYHTYQKDYEADDLCDCGCLGDGDCNDVVTPELSVKK